MKNKDKLIKSIIVILTFLIIAWIIFSEYRNFQINKVEFQYNTTRTYDEYTNKGNYPNKDTESNIIRNQYKYANKGNYPNKDTESDIIRNQYEYSNKDKYYKGEIESNIITNQSQYPKEEIIKEYKGFEVSAKLEIPAIKLETYILKNFSEEALNISVTKFWGSNPNEIGNLCVAGHNFKNKNMFRNLKKLKIGDTFTISDNNIGKIEYQIYNIYRVSPDDVSCLIADMTGIREVTLITCTSNSKERIIVKAQEFKNGI